MSASYLLLSSSFRNRLLNPNPSDFVIPFQSLHSIDLNLSVLNTLNPITKFPIYTFCWTNFKTNEIKFKTKIVGGSGNRIFLEDNVYTELLGFFPNREGNSPYLLQNPEVATNILTNYTVSIQENQSTILTYSVSYNSIEIQETLPFSIGDDIYIENQIYNLNKEQNSSELIIINGPFISQYLNPSNNSLLIYNINLNEYRYGIYLSDIGSLALEEPFSNVSTTDKYMLYQTNIQLLNGVILPFDLNGKYYIQNALLAFDLIEKGVSYKHQQRVVFKFNKNDPILPEDTIYRIDSVNSSGEILHIVLDQMGNQTFRNSQSYYVLPLQGNVISIAKILVSRVGTVFRFLPNEKTQPFSRPLDYVGNYFQCLLLSPLFTVFEDQLFVSPNFTMPVYGDLNPLSLQQSQELNGVFGIRSASVIQNASNEVLLHVESIPPDLLYRFDLIQKRMENGTLPSPFIGCFNTLIYFFIREGVVPLNFTGTYLTQSQMSCYELTILNLILPNTPIESINSFLTSGFPYVFVEISNVTLASSHNRNSLITNNPNATFATFVCSISDVNNPLTSKFIKISSDGSVQTMKFSPADNLRFRITLPNGQPFISSLRDYLPPSLPNPLLQIDCLFEIKKLG